MTRLHLLLIVGVFLFAIAALTSQLVLQKEVTDSLSSQTDLLKTNLTVLHKLEITPTPTATPAAFLRSTGLQARKAVK